METVDLLPDKEIQTKGPVSRAFQNLNISGFRTKETTGEAEPIDEFLYEESIEPDQIGEYKVELHKAFMKMHYGEECFDRMWAIREQCIRAISE